MAKKKQSLIWRMTKFTAKGIGKGIASSYKLTKRQVKQSKEKRKLEKNPIYNSKPQFEKLSVINTISGDFSALQERLNSESSVVLIFGRRGIGKSSLGFKLLENIHSRTKRQCHVLGIEQKFLPKWISPIQEIESAKSGSAVLVDEGALSFSSRDSMSLKNKDLSKLLAIARHKDLSIFFITQNTGLIDKNVLALSDTLIIKQGSLLQMQMERPEMKKFYTSATKQIEKQSGSKKPFAYFIDAEFEGLISHNLPSFWTDSLSKNKA